MITELGLSEFVTISNGFSGKVKSCPEDFIVTEVAENGVPVCVVVDALSRPADIRSNPVVRRHQTLSDPQPQKSRGLCRSSAALLFSHVRAELS